jgi:RecA-family ATPase
MDGIPPEIPPMMDFETFERETELELAGKGQKANGADPPVRFKSIINPADWEGKPRPERKWIIRDVIPDEAPTLLYGDGGLGKSLAGLQLAAVRSIAETTTDWFGFLPEPGRTLVLSSEDDEDEMHRRLDDCRFHYGATWAQLKDIRLVDLVGEDSILGELMKGRISPAPMYQALDDYMTEFSPGLVILDVLAEMFAGDENNRPQVSQFVGLLKRLCRKHKCAILLLAHPSRAGLNSGSGDSGSTGWNGAVRSRLYLSRATASDGAEPDPNLRKFEVKKSNYGPPSVSVTVEWKKGVFVLASGQKAGGLDRIALEAKADRIFLELLAEFEDQGRDVSPNRSSTFAPTEFAKIPEADGVTKKSFEAAMARLLKAKSVYIETFGPSSHQRKRLRTSARPACSSPEF